MDAPEHIRAIYQLAFETIEGTIYCERSVFHEFEAWLLPQWRFVRQELWERGIYNLAVFPTQCILVEGDG